MNFEEWLIFLSGVSIGISISNLMLMIFKR